MLTSLNLNIMEEQREQIDQQELVNQIYGFTADMLFNQKKSVEETKAALIGNGLKPEDADIVISNLQNQYKQEKKEAGNKNMLYGALWCVGGLLVTFLTYSAASNGGTYVVAWGAVIFGAIQFFKGVFQRIG